MNVPTPKQIESTHQRALKADAGTALIRIIRMRNTITALRMEHTDRNEYFERALSDAENALQRLAKFL